MCSRWRGELTIRSLELKGKDIPQDFLILVHLLGVKWCRESENDHKFTTWIGSFKCPLKKKDKKWNTCNIWIKLSQHYILPRFFEGRHQNVSKSEFFLKLILNVFFSFLGRILWMQNPVGWQRNSGTKFGWVLVLNNFICSTWNITFLKKIIVRRAWALNGYHAGLQVSQFMSQPWDANEKKDKWWEIHEKPLTL